MGPKGEVYDIKGIGWIVPTLDIDEQTVSMAVAEWTTTPGNDDDDVRGLLNMKEAKKDYEMGEKLHSLGIRTARMVAVLKLNELVHKHHKYSVADMRLAALAIDKKIGQSGRLPENYEPVLAIRQFGSKM